MSGPIGRWAHVITIVALFLTFVGAKVVHGQTSVRLPTSTIAPQASPEQDDATLYDVQLIGARLGWAVGDRGTVWKTEDGGKTWTFRPTGAKCSLRSVCFLTDQIGWAAGGDIAQYNRTPYGVVLGTTDGGQTWTELSRDKLPFLSHVAFFGLDQGIAVGAANSAFPTGVAFTRDGGKTWQPAPGAASPGWRAAAFVDEKTGALAGLRGRFTTFGGGGVAEQAGDPLGLRGLHAVDLQLDGRGWMVGDGGLVLATTSAGAGWTEPSQPLPAALRDCFDMQSVCSHASRVWIAGSPGSAVWHSPDAGATWQPQPLADSAPLYAIDFSTETRGCAVGAFGRILTTEDGGQTWTSARGAGRRTALLAMHAAADRSPVRLLIKASAEEGFRSVVQLTARRDVGPDGHLEADTDLRLQQVVAVAGGNTAAVAWELPLGVAGLDRDYNRLLEQWSQLTDGRLPDVMLQELVTNLRTWRPDVIVIDEPSPHEAAATLLRQAILSAVAQAADPQQYGEQQTLMHLSPWQVQRVFARLPAGQATDVTLDPHEILPRHGRTLVMASSPATALLGVDNTAGAESYRLIFPSAQGADAPRRSLFNGLSLKAGGESRRELPPLNDFDYDAVENLAQHQRNFSAWRDRALGNEALASQVIAQLEDVLDHAPPEQAALQLAALADGYFQRSQWQLAEETLIELAQRYPNEPPAVDGMVRLLQMWTSQELGWRRARGVSANKTEVTVNGQVTQAVVNETQSLLGQNGGLERVRQLAQSADSPLLIQPAEAQVSIGGQENQRGFDARRWYEQAVTVAADLKKRWPSVYAEPDVQFACAALYRKQEMYQQSDEIYRALGSTSDPAWQIAARGELWTLGAANESPKPVNQCARTNAPPVLDGLLSDDCWKNAGEITLTPPESEEGVAPASFVGSKRSRPAASGTTATGSGAFAMLSYDARFLYFAASLPRAPGLSTAGVQYAGRTHDADLSDFDRVTLLLDVDRDYATYYRFEVDSRGQTRESCWGDQSWDPKWFVANDADTQRWTIEAAIPLAELTPQPAIGGQVWGVGILRTMPAVGVESWTHPSGAVPRPATFGMVRMR